MEVAHREAQLRSVRVALLVLLLASGLLLAACGNDEPADNGDEPETVTVVMTDFAFEPSELTIAAGTTVEFVNQGQVEHDVVEGEPGGDNPLFASPEVNRNETWSYTFEQAGTYDIHCSVGGHYALGMVMTVVVE